MEEGVDELHRQGIKLYTLTRPSFGNSDPGGLDDPIRHAASAIVSLARHLRNRKLASDRARRFPAASSRLPEPCRKNIFDPWGCRLSPLSPVGKFPVVSSGAQDRFPPRAQFPTHGRSGRTVLLPDGCRQEGPLSRRVHVQRLRARQGGPAQPGVRRSGGVCRQVHDRAPAPRGRGRFAHHGSRLEQGPEPVPDADPLAARRG